MNAHRESPEEIADDDADEVRLTEELNGLLLEMGLDVEAVGLVVVVVVVVVGSLSSSSSSYTGVPSCSIVIGMSGSIQPGGNLIEPGG